jgi:4-amino-4-deoxy-L-arabinose transferase-like glycosyltransferase
LLIAIAVGASVLRVLVVIATPGFVPFGDPADYQRHAVSIAAGQGFPTSQAARVGSPSAFRPPAYPFLLGGVYAVAGVHLTLGRLLGACLGTLTVILLGILAREVWGRRVGLLAAGLAAVFPPLVLLNASLMSEALFLPVELAVAICLIHLSRGAAPARWAIAAGALCAVAALTRTVGILFLLPAIAIAATSGHDRRSRVLATTLTVAAAALVLTPWTVRNASELHAFLPLGTQSGPTLVGEYNSDAAHHDAFYAVPRIPPQIVSLRPQLERLYNRPGGINEAQLNSRLLSWGLTFAANHPGYVLAASTFNALRLIDVGPAHSFTTSLSYREMGIPNSLQTLTTLSVWATIAIVLAGLVMRFTRRLAFSTAPWWLWTLPVLAIIATIPYAGSPRYRTPADPFLLLLAAITIIAVIDRRRTSSRELDGGSDLPRGETLGGVGATPFRLTPLGLGG